MLIPRGAFTVAHPELRPQCLAHVKHNPVVGTNFKQAHGQHNNQLKHEKVLLKPRRYHLHASC